LADLLRITDTGAEDVLSGRYDGIVPRDLRFPSESRWAARLHADPELDLWLLSWAPDQATELHDHAGSLGALTVLSGAVAEYRWTGESLRRRVLSAGDQAGFPLGWVHDVVREGESAESSADHPTLSVHAYSPPLTAMSYYRVDHHRAGGPVLLRTRTILSDQPEMPWEGEL
jgi:hypothetical protein